jgi:tRNA pseudouridine32 synthase/23S rRNA pseudouridine746 synthase
MRTLSSRSIQDAVVFEDRHLLVLEKESGLLSQPGLGPSQYDSLIIRSQKYWPSARIVHRLDRDTSGLIVLALDSDTHRELSRQFSERTIKKIYRAQIAGTPSQVKGIIEAPIRRKSTQPPIYCVDFKDGKSAFTKWMKIESIGSSTRVELHPVTGRSHQLRVHMQYLGHPILGDPLYGDEHSRNKFTRLGLHASGLALQHPQTKKWLQWNSREPF